MCSLGLGSLCLSTLLVLKCGPWAASHSPWEPVRRAGPRASPRCWAGLCFVAQSCPTPCDPGDCGPPGSSVHGDSPGKNTGVGCLALLQEIFPSQGLNPGLPHCRQILYSLSHQGSTPGALNFKFWAWVGPRSLCLKALTGNSSWQPITSILAWKIPWTEEPGGLQSSGLQRIGHN